MSIRLSISARVNGYSFSRPLFALNLTVKLVFWLLYVFRINCLLEKPIYRVNSNLLSQIIISYTIHSQDYSYDKTIILLINIQQDYSYSRIYHCISFLLALCFSASGVSASCLIATFLSQLLNLLFEQFYAHEYSVLLPAISEFCFFMSIIINYNLYCTFIRPCFLISPKMWSYYILM